jgi:predicted PurR-regulated permease PerM
MLLLAGLLTYGGGAQGLLPALAFFVLNGIENNLVTPLLLGRRLTLNPVVLFVGLVFWSWIWGIPGGLLAVPMMATFKILCDNTATFAPLGKMLSAAAVPRPRPRSVCQSSSSAITSISVATLSTPSTS